MNISQVCNAVFLIFQAERFPEMRSVSPSGSTKFFFSGTFAVVPYLSYIAGPNHRQTKFCSEIREPVMSLAHFNIILSHTVSFTLADWTVRIS